MVDYFKVLGLNSSASDEEIKTAYRKLSKKFHPDMNDGDKFFEERFKEIQTAYEKLNDPNYRTAFRNFQNKGAYQKSEYQTNSKKAEHNPPPKPPPSPTQPKTKKPFISSGAIITFLVLAGLGIFRAVMNEEIKKNGLREYRESLGKEVEKPLTEENNNNTVFDKTYIYKFQNDAYESNSSTGILKNRTPLFDSPSSTDINYFLNPNEEIICLGIEKHILKMASLKVTSFPRKNDFPDCVDDNLHIGDTIYLLRNYGEGSHEVLHKGRKIFVNAFYDISHNAMIESGYEGCNNICGKFIHSKEVSTTFVKVKLKNGKVGYLKNLTIDDFKKGFHFPEFEYNIKEGL